MANIKSAKKRIHVIAKKSMINKGRKTALKTAEKKFLEAIEAGDKALATERFQLAEKKFAQAAANNTVHKNAAARKVSNMAKKLNTLA